MISADTRNKKSSDVTWSARHLSQMMNLCIISYKLTKATFVHRNVNSSEKVFTVTLSCKLQSTGWLFQCKALGSIVWSDMWNIRWWWMMDLRLEGPGQSDIGCKTGWYKTMNTLIDKQRRLVTDSLLDWHQHWRYPFSLLGASDKGTSSILNHLSFVLQIRTTDSVTIVKLTAHKRINKCISFWTRQSMTDWLIDLSCCSEGSSCRYGHVGGVDKNAVHVLGHNKRCVHHNHNVWQL